MATPSAPIYSVRVLKPTLQKSWLDDDIGDSDLIPGANIPTNPPGYIGNAAQFVLASQQTLWTPSNAALVMGDIPMAGFAWVRLDSKPASASIFSKWFTLTREYRLRYHLATDRFEFRVSSNGVAVTGVAANTFGAPALGTKYLIRFYHDPVTNLIGISVNDGAWDTAAHAGGIFAGIAAFNFSYNGDTGGEWWDGLIDDTGIFKNRIPTAAEWTRIYNGGDGLRFSDWSTDLKENLVAYWSFDAESYILAEPLEVENVTFTETVSVPNQSDPGSFTLTLKDTWAFPHLKVIYDQLDYEQRIEIGTNEHFLGDPVFSGVIRQLPSDLQKSEVRGPGILWRLDERRLRRQEILSGNAAIAMTNLLKTYQPIFSDDFDRVALGADWNAPLNFAIVNGEAVSTGFASQLMSSVSYDAAVWDDAKYSFNIRLANGAPEMYCHFANILDGYAIVPYVQVNAERSEIQIYKFVAGVGALFATRFFPAEVNSPLHFDIYTSIEAGGRRIIVDLNGVEMFNVVDAAGVSWPGDIAFQGLDADSVGAAIDNVVLMQKMNALTAGVVDVTVETIDQTFNADSQRAALDWIAAYMNWEYRVNAGKGAGNDTIDIGADVGRDFTEVLILEEGKNIENLQVTRSADELATWVQVYAQGADDAANNFVAVDIAAMRQYGIIEADFSDSLILDSVTAKIMGDMYLTEITDRAESISGRVVDESHLLRQSPVWGYAVFGDFVWGGRQRVRAGDWVWLLSPKRNIDREARIVSLTRRSGDPGIDLVFDRFRMDGRTALKRAREQLMRARREFIRRMNALGGRLVFPGAGTETYAATLSGTYNAVILNVRSAAWGGFSLTALVIDGVDRTIALGGPWLNDFHVDVLAYVPHGGDHDLAFTMNGGPITLDVGVVTKLLA